MLFCVFPLCFAFILSAPAAGAPAAVAAAFALQTAENKLYKYDSSQRYEKNAESYDNIFHLTSSYKDRTYLVDRQRRDISDCALKNRARQRPL